MLLGIRAEGLLSTSYAHLLQIGPNLLHSIRAGILCAQQLGRGREDELCRRI